MIAAAEVDLLYPLTLFCQNGGHPLPSFKIIEGANMPEPYRTLLVHRGDMTSRLEEFHSMPMTVEALHRELTEEGYRREVVLRGESNGKAVEYGAIEIDLSAFDGPLRRLILEEHLPLGGLLNHFGVKYRSEPRAFFQLGSDPVMQRVFAMPEARRFFGRSNLLYGEEDRLLARIVEVLRPHEVAPA